MIKKLAMSGFVCIACACCNVHARAQSTPSSLSSLQFLTGEWAGGGSTAAGQATGRSSITSDLGGHVLVRRDHTDIPAANGRPASTIDILMLIYPQASDGKLHATYTDSEGHVIQYTAQQVAPDHMVEFDSAVSPNSPTFRLTYTLLKPAELEVKFEMAMPGKNAVFRSIAVGTLRRSNK